jgi:hypothetical protein
MSTALNEELAKRGVAEYRLGPLFRHAGLADEASSSSRLIRARQDRSERATDLLDSIPADSQWRATPAPRGDGPRRVSAYFPRSMYDLIVFKRCLAGYLPLS